MYMYGLIEMHDGWHVMTGTVEGFIGGWRDCDEISHLMLTEEREHNPRMVKGVFAFVGSVLSLPLSSSHSHAFAF